MWNFHEYRIFYFSKVLMIGILQGVCVVLADTNTMTVYRANGSSLDLMVNLSKESVSRAEWSFNKKSFYKYSRTDAYTPLKSQFTGRIKEESDKVGVIVQRLQPLDAGKFSIVVDGTEGQLPTKIFTVYIQDSITSVQIEKNQTWMLSTNRCDISVKCSALRAESVSYLWSGYKTGNGADLQFSLSPAEGAVTLNCTADNKVSSSSVTETLSCMENPTISPESPLSVLKLVSFLVAASPYLLVTIILSVKYYKARGHHDSQHDVTEE